MSFVSLTKLIFVEQCFACCEAGGLKSEWDIFIALYVPQFGMKIGQHLAKLSASLECPF